MAIIVKIMPTQFRWEDGRKTVDAASGKEKVATYPAFQAVIQNGKSDLNLTAKRIETFAEMGCDPIILAECKSQMAEADRLTREANPGRSFDKVSKASKSAVSSVSYAELKARALAAGTAAPEATPGKRLKA